MEKDVLTQISERYETLCFSLERKHSELEQLKVDIFTHNPKFQKLITEITQLENEKNDLEDLMNGRKD
jgi:chromosome segregation ATPase